jgi:hypothetical protein
MPRVLGWRHPTRPFQGRTDVPFHRHNSGGKRLSNTEASLLRHHLILSRRLFVYFIVNGLATNRLARTLAPPILQYHLLVVDRVDRKLHGSANVFGSGHADGQARAQSGVVEPGCHCSQARVEAPADFVN